MAVKREYDSSRRQRQAAQTRADIVRAARHLFAERGYPATTIEAIAAEAEVSVATVYAGFGSKAGILSALQRLMQEEIDYDARVREVGEAAGNPPEQIAAGVRISVSFPAQHADIIAALLSARGTDPDVDEFLHRGMVVEHRNGWGFLASVLASQDALRPGLSEKEAGDLGAALTRVEVYRVLSGELGWSRDRITEVLTAILCNALLRADTER
jgi:TetR/AcrR family transcriptional regulator, regulator of cefoperazone and chloramphenicol sensitivity